MGVSEAPKLPGCSSCLDAGPAAATHRAIPASEWIRKLVIHKKKKDWVEMDYI